MQHTKSTFHLRLANPTTIVMTVAAIVAMVVAATLALAPPPLVHADHDSTYVECPDPIREGEWGWMRARKPDHKLNFVTVFTYNGAYTASGNDYYEYHGVRLDSRQGENSVWVPVGALEDTEAEHDETFAIGFWVQGTWHGCVVTIEDDDAPEITFVEISSSPSDWYGYRAGDSIDVTVNVDAEVEVAGTPHLSLYIGDEGTTWRGARYHSGSGTRGLVFRYRVQPQDRDSDGITVSGAASNDDGSPAYGFGGDIFAAGTDVPINYSHPIVQGGGDHRVDGRPYVQSARITSSPPDGWQAYRANQTIEVSLTFDMDVVVEGEVTAGFSLGLRGYDWDEARREANYLRGSGTDTLVFGYTVVPGDMDRKGIQIATASPVGNPVSSLGGSGAVKAAGTDVDSHERFIGTDRLSDQIVDTEPPAVSSLSITSRPADRDAYTAGETITVDVTFSEPVTPRGPLRLELDVGGTARHAALRSLPGRTFTNTLVFDYTVQPGDEDTDGIGISANSLKLDGGGIHDIAGNDAGLSHDTVVADPAHKVAA